MPIFQKDIRRCQLQDGFFYWFYIPAAVIGSGLMLDWFLGFRRFHWPGWSHFIAVSLVAVGTLLMQRSIRDLARYGKGTPNPHRPPKKLVTEGVYGLCRHPMFLGYDLAALGVVLFFRSPSMILVSFTLFLLFEIPFLKKEEKFLSRRYKSAFLAYQKKVPMLLPLFRRGE
jgi:protein-S-isoprenylcysteine O-methyltransferase Ste14